MSKKESPVERPVTVLFAHGFADDNQSRLIRCTEAVLPEHYTVRASMLGFVMKRAIGNAGVYMPHPLEQQREAFAAALRNQLEEDAGTLVVSHSQGTFAALHALSTVKSPNVRSVAATPVVDPRTEYRRILRCESECASGEALRAVQDVLLDTPLDQHFVLQGLRSAIPIPSPKDPAQIVRYAVLSEDYVASLGRASTEYQGHIDILNTLVGRRCMTLALAQLEDITDATPEVLQDYMDPDLLEYDGPSQNAYIIPGADHNLYGCYSEFANIIAAGSDEQDMVTA
jgi:hypothetical protein